MSQTDPLASETQSQVIVRLLLRGGFVLIAGGESKDLPDRIKRHPQVLIWDDNQQKTLHKSVPSNVRAIVYNRWVSHSMAGKLREAASKLGVPVFPMLHTREIKLLLSEVVQEVKVVNEVEQLPEPTIGEKQVHDVPLSDQPEEPQGKGFLTTEDMMRPIKRGEWKEILAAELKQGESGTKEVAARLMPIIKSKYHIKTNDDALRQAIFKFRSTAQVQVKVDTSVVKASTSSSIVGKTDDFVEVEKLLRDAKTAIDLALEFIPKVRKRVETMDNKRKKLLDLLGD